MLRILALLKLFRKDIIVMMLAVRHADTPKKVKGMFLAGLLYLLSPVDFIPDMIPFAGIVDDAVIVPGMIYGLMQMLPLNVKNDSEAKARNIMRHMPVILVAVSLFIIVWIVMILWGIYSLISYFAT